MSTQSTNAPARTTQVSVTFLLSLTTVVSFFLHGKPAAQFVAIGGLVIVLGSVATSIIGTITQSRLLNAIIAMSEGALFVMLVGAFVGSVFPHFGDHHPLQQVTVTAMWIVVLAACTVWCIYRRIDPVRDLVGRVSRRDVTVVCSGATLPLLALIGSGVSTAHGTTSLAIAVGVLAAIVACLAVIVPSGWSPALRPTMLASSMLAALWQLPFSGGWLSGWDIQHEYAIASATVSQGVFPVALRAGSISDPYSGMLSLSVWPAQLHDLTGMSLRSIMGLVPSVFLVGAMLVVFVAARSRVGERLATLVTILFVAGSIPMLQELPAVTRQCAAFLFLGVLLLGLFSPSLTTSVARRLTVIGGIGVAVTHYSTAFLMAGGLIVAYVLTLIVRSPRTVRVLTFPVCAAVVGLTALWESVVAHTGASVVNVWRAISVNGLELLPSGGNIVSRWVHGASISSSISTTQLIAYDEKLRETSLRWMSVDPNAAKYLPAAATTTTSRGIPIVGGVTGLENAVVSQIIVLASVVAVIMILIRLRREPTLCVAAGMGLFALAMSVLSRTSQSIAIEFGPSRVQGQMYMVFALVVCIAIPWWSTSLRLLYQRWRLPRWLASAKTWVAIAGLVAALYFATGAGLTELAQKGVAVTPAYSNTGSLAERDFNSSDIAAARWLVDSVGPLQVVQADEFGRLALWDFGTATSNRLLGTIDPVTVDNSSWIYAYHTNVVLGLASGSNTVGYALFHFPTAYFESTRSILYASADDTVYGSNALRWTPVLPNNASAS